MRESLTSLALRQEGVPNNRQLLNNRHHHTRLWSSTRTHRHMMMHEWHTICSAQIYVHAMWIVISNTWRITLMLRTVGKIFGGTMVMLCLVSALAMAQSQSSSWRFLIPSQLQAQAQRQSQAMPCTQDDGKGNCTAGVARSGQVIAFTGEDVHTGDAVFCIIADNTMSCTKIVTK
jgi:hypothetical protein